MNPVVTKSILGLSGALLLIIGAAVLFTPETFATANGIALGDDPSLKSEYRAPGGMLVASAVFVLLGAVRRRYMRSAFALAALIYGSYGIARLIGIGADGMPSEGLVQAMIVELLIGSICLVGLVRLGLTKAGGGQSRTGAPGGNS